MAATLAAFGSALVARARADLGRVVELSPNSGPVVDVYLANVGGSPGSNWCAAAVWTWTRDAAQASGAPRVLEVVRPTGGAKDYASGPKRAGWWLDASAVSSPDQVPPGSVSIWDRSDPPGSGWQGHIGVVEAWRGPGTWDSIEGNSGPAGDRVARMARTLSDPRLLGFVVWGRAASSPAWVWVLALVLMPGPLTLAAAYAATRKRKRGR
jgi:hypothetical protein